MKRFLTVILLISLLVLPSCKNQSETEKLLSSMTLEEKVGQLFFVRCPAENGVQDVKEYHLGGYILYDRDLKGKTADDIIQSILQYKDVTDIPLLIGVDEEGGTVVRVSSNTNIRAKRFEAPQQLFKEGGMELVLQDTHQKDILLSALGINVNFAPVADVSTDSSNFIYARSFGKDATSTANYTSLVVQQMSKDNVGSVLKHFPGYGPNVDTHTGIAVDKRPLETFLTQDMLPFHAYTGSQNKSAILVSHNIITCLDDGLPASLSPAVHKLLRDKLGFDRVAITDDLTMDAVKAYAADGSVAVMALQAGNDMVITSDYRNQIPKVIEAVKNGTLSEDMIDKACLRVLSWKKALGLI